MHGEAVQIIDRRVLVLENEEKTRLRAEITYTFQGPPLRRGGWVPHVMQTDSKQKKPNRRAWCTQPPSGYK
jgi:hypothetical protein